MSNNELRLDDESLMMEPARGWRIYSMVTVVNTDRPDETSFARSSATRPRPSDGVIYHTVKRLENVCHDWDLDENTATVSLLDPLSMTRALYVPRCTQGMYSTTIQDRSATATSLLLVPMPRDNNVAASSMSTLFLMRKKKYLDRKDDKNISWRRNNKSSVNTKPPVDPVTESVLIFSAESILWDLEQFCEPVATLDRSSVRVAETYVCTNHDVILHADSSGADRNPDDMKFSDEMHRQFFAKYKRGRNSCEDEVKTGRPPTATIQANVQTVEKLIRENRTNTYKEVEQKLDIGLAAVQIIIHDHLSFCRDCSRWVPHKRTDWCDKTPKSDLVLLWHHDDVVSHYAIEVNKTSAGCISVERQSADALKGVKSYREHLSPI
ncbi:hypothetical protein EVAR_29176_1 [Eumeta japonica]|uniref:Mariner Mos1 transposase n=1 Tax=Eumeta variegata TaxID=151549 RepID=A0A4C1VB84_EUMVA|nr:hypothetical protein EVAR_29176_1 [Eumeta japonica]